MDKLVIVKFEGNSKEYAFLTTLDPIKPGDKVMDKRYDKPFVVKLVEPYFLNTFRGHFLKWLTGETVLWIESETSKPKENQMEKRTVKISFEQAKEWYYNGNETLRKLALSAYTEEELTEPQTFEGIVEAMGLDLIKIVASEKTSKGKYGNAISSILTKERINLKLAVIAEYFNKGWKPRTNEKKFFIAKGTSYSCSARGLGNEFYVCSHETVRYPGIVYFKTQEDAIKAFNMLKDAMNDLYR